MMLLLICDCKRHCFPDMLVWPAIAGDSVFLKYIGDADWCGCVLGVPSCMSSFLTVRVLAMEEVHEKHAQCPEDFIRFFLMVLWWFCD